MRCKAKVLGSIPEIQPAVESLYVGEPFKNRTLQLSDGFQLRYDRIQSITPQGFQDLLEKVLKAVLVGRPLHVKIFLAEYLDAELARRTFCDIVFGCHLKKSIKDHLYPTASCICLGVAQPPVKLEEHVMVSECLDSFTRGPIPMYEMKAPALDRYRQLVGLSSDLDLKDSAGDGHGIGLQGRHVDEWVYAEGVPDSSSSDDGSDDCVVLPTCGCEFCALQTSLAVKPAAFNVHAFQGEGCADYTWYPCYQYSSVPVPGCTGKHPHTHTADDSEEEEEEKDDQHKHKHHGGRKRKHRSGKHVSVLYDVFGETYLTQPEELSGENFTMYGDAENELVEATYDHERLFTEPESSPPDEVFGPSFEQDTPFDDHLQPEHSQGEQDFMKEHVDVDAHMVDFVEYALHKGDPAEQDTSVDYSMMLSGEEDDDEGSDDDDGSSSSSTSSVHVSHHGDLSGLPHIPTPAFEGPANPDPMELKGELTTVYGVEPPYDDQDVLFYDNPSYQPVDWFGPTFQQHEPFGGTLQPGYVYGEQVFADEIGTSDEIFMQQVLEGSPESPP